MKYDELKKFIINEMKPFQGKNYQPVMIKTLNQNKGYATRGQLKIELQKANPDYELSYFSNCPVFEVLTKSHPVAEYDEANETFHLLDYETFNDAEKAWITNYCVQKISGDTTKYVVLENKKEIENAQKTMLENLKQHTTKKDNAEIGFPGPGENVSDIVYYISDVNLWWYSKIIDNVAIPRYWNCFGLGEPNWEKTNNIVLEINPPLQGISRITKGAFVKDQNGVIYITHSGGLGGGNTPGGFDVAYPHQDKWILADDGKNEPRELILISDITSQKLPEHIADYVQNVSKYKSGSLLPVTVPYYLLFRHKSENNPYEDDPSGKTYHFPKRNPNATKVIPGAKSIWFDKIDKSYYFWGYGTVSKVKSRTEKDSDAVFEDFTFFEKQPDSLELNEKFLKKATPEIEQKITNSPGYNNQHSILEISKEIFEDIVDNKKIENNDQYDVGHKLFLIEMNQKEHKTQFIDFNHVDFVNDEVDYKKVILEKSLIELSLDKWDEWISTPEKICQAVRNAVASKISKTLIWAPPFNTEIGYFDELDNLSKVEFGKSLYELFKGSALIEKRFDNFVLSLKKIEKKPERLLSYLLFLYDSEKYFPIHPTNFDNLLEFYGFEKIKENSWKKYSQYLELASKLKSFLAQKFSSVELSNIQIQSYMWVIAGAVSKKYWMIRPGTNGEDWENQRNAGIIGIHYYTIDLSEYAQSNNQLAKRRLHDRMHELRYAEGKEPDSQPALDADFGQFEKIFAIRKNDKIMAIGNNSTLLGIGNATDKYQFRTDVGENCHTIPVDWYDVESREIPKQEIRRTIKQLHIKDYVDIMSSQTTVQKSKYEKFFNILNKKKQFFFYGPPGTGKTFTAKKIAEAFTNQNNSNLENRRHTWKSVTTLVLLENKGLPLNYHEIAKRALEKDLVQTIGETPHETLAKIMREDIQQLGSDSYFIKPSDGIYGLNIPTTFAKAAEVILYAENKPLHYTEITKKAINSQIVLSEGLTPEKSLLAEITKNIQTKGDKSNFIQISDGTYALRKQNPLSNTDIDFNDNFIENVTFHQSYGYEEFVEGIRPSPTENGITYTIEPGIFRKFCEKARNDPKQNYVMIIDEINRGNISKIFGELITIMENDKRETTVTLAYSKKPFSVPSNVYLIGTMNTADRSLVHIDAALKRRFVQYELMPDYSQIDAKIGRVHLGKLLDTLNQKIIAANFRDNQMGHSYFMKDANPITTIEELQFAFAYDIVPLLKDYFYDDDKILHIILGNEFIDENRNIVTEWTEKESLFMNILEKAYPEAFDKA